MANVDVSKTLDFIDKSIRELRLEYEQFFAGDVRKEPTKQRKAIRRAILECTQTHIGNTGLKFRLLSLQGTFNSYQRLWDRSAYEIEAGIYRPHLFKVEIHPPKDKKDQTAETPPAAKDDMEELYTQYMDARTKTAAAGKVSYDAFKKSLETQKQTLQEKLGGEVRFKVVVEDGKAKVKGVKAGKS